MKRSLRKPKKHFQNFPYQWRWLLFAKQEESLGLLENEEFAGALRGLDKDRGQDSLPIGKQSLLFVHLPETIKDPFVVSALVCHSGNGFRLDLQTGLNHVQGVHNADLDETS